MSNTPVLARRAAFVAQSQLCFYCNAPTWEQSSEHFVRKHCLPNVRRHYFAAPQNTFEL